MSIDESTAADGMRVVVVDDHRDSADALLLLLKVLGFEAKAAYNATDGLALVRSFRPHCVLSDIEMPDMTGYELAQRIRREDDFRNIPLIAISGNCDPALADAAGFNYYLTKPVPAITLTSLLRKVLNMDAHLERAEKLIEKQGAVVGEARDLMREVKEDVKEIKSDLDDVKRDVKEIKDDLREVKSHDNSPPSA